MGRADSDDVEAPYHDRVCGLPSARSLQCCCETARQYPHIDNRAWWRMCEVMRRGACTVQAQPTGRSHSHDIQVRKREFAAIQLRCDRKVVMSP